MFIMESREHQTNTLANLEYNVKLQKALKSKTDQQEASTKSEVYKKVKGHNVEGPHESVLIYKADENEENGNRTIIKIEKFECSDDIFPQIAVEQYEPEQSRKNQTNVLVKLEQPCKKLDNILDRKTGQLEKGKKNEGHRKVEEDEFGHNVDAPHESIQNDEVDENEENGNRTIIKIEKFECSDDIFPQIAVEQYEPEQSRKNQTNVLVKLEQPCKKLDNILNRKTDQLEKSKKNEGHRKIEEDEFGHNVDAPHESIQNDEADEKEELGTRTIIKVEKFECSDDILPQIAVEYYDTEQGREDKTNVLLKLKQPCKKLDNVLDTKTDQLEENKKNEGHRKVEEDEFGHNVDAPHESIQNDEVNENEENGNRTIIKIEKFECSDDILPQIAVEHYEPEQSRENQTNVLVKLEQPCKKLGNVLDRKTDQLEASKENEFDNLEHPYEKLSQTSQVILNKPKEYEVNKDCTTVVASAMYEFSNGSKSSTKPYLKHGKRGGDNQNRKLLNTIDAFDNISDNYEDTIRSELSQDDDSTSVSVETSKVLVTDSQCYVALEKLSYKCDNCRYVTVIKELLVSHMKLHDNKQSDSISECDLQLNNQIISEKYEHKQLADKLFRCNLCSYKSAQKSNLKRHQLTHTSEKPFACNLCSYKSARKSCLNTHKLTHTDQKPFACNLCSYKSAQKSAFNIHKRKHTGEKPFACNLCSYKTAQKSSLNIHKLIHTGKKTFACNLCSYKSVQKSSLTNHKLTHACEKPFACNLCSYKSANKTHLKIHKLIHTDEKPFACNLCSYRGASKKYLKKHKLRHNCEKPFACNLCSYKSALKSILNIHKLIHTGKKTFACNLCSYKSVQKSSLTKHKLTHACDKPFACNLCSYKTAYKAHIRRHQLKHSGEKRFACNLCSYKTAYKSDFNIHMLSHTGEKPFACNLCSFKTIYKKSLKTHTLVHQ